MSSRALDIIAAEVKGCSRCPRLVKYRVEVARKRPKRYEGWSYWARPVPGFGDPEARIMIIGLAPAAHGGNRTGRMFTGDGSGNTLIRALYDVGLANQPLSEHRDDGLKLAYCYLTASIRCAPPENKPTRQEMENCFCFLRREFETLEYVKVLVALGRIAFDTSLKLLKSYGYSTSCRSRPVFRHGAKYRFVLMGRSDEKWLLASYHPSRQNTQTGRLSQAMLNSVFREACRLAGLTL